MQRLVEGLRGRGIQVISADESEQTLHASGHLPGGLADLYQILKPTLAIPVHARPST